MTNYRQTMADALKLMYLMREYKLMERELTPAEEKKRENVAKDLDDADFKKRYGDRWKEVKMAVATKITKGEKMEGFDLEEGDPDFSPVKGRKVKTVNMTHKTSGKEVVVVDNPKKIKEMEKLGFVKEEVDLDDKIEKLPELDEADINPKSISFRSLVDVVQDLLKELPSSMKKRYKEEVSKIMQDLGVKEEAEIVEATGMEIKKWFAGKGVKVKVRKIGSKYISVSPVDGDMPNEWRKRVLDKVDFFKDAKTDMNNIEYGNVRARYIAISPNHWDEFMKEDADLDEYAGSLYNIEPGDEKAAAAREKKEKKYHDKAKADMKAGKSVAWYLDRKQGAGQKWSTGTETWFAAQDYMKKFKEDIDEATKWKMGDGRPRGAAHIENIRYWDLPKDQLQYIMKDAGEAMKANPTARKATTGPGNWADQVNDAHTVLGWRKKKGIKEDVDLVKAVANIIRERGPSPMGARHLPSKSKNYYEIGGDRYDAGVVFNVYVNGKKVHNQILDADDDYEYKGRKYDNVDKAMDAIAKAHGLKAKDFKRVNMEEVDLDEVIPKSVAYALVDAKTNEILEKGSKKLMMRSLQKRKKQGQKTTLHLTQKKVGDKVLGIGEDLDEGAMSQLHHYIKIGWSAEKIAKTMKVDVETIKKLMSESARSDAKKAMISDPQLGRRKDDDDDDVATDDEKGESKNIIMQMRKVVSLRGNFKVEFADGKKKKIDPKIAHAVQNKYDTFRTSQDKEKFQAKVAKSYKDMLNALKEGNEMQEGFEKVVLNLLKRDKIGGYFSNGKLYVDMRDMEDTKASMKDAMKRKDISQIPSIVGEANESKLDLVDTIRNKMSEAKEKGPRQLIDPNKEAMIVKKNKVIVIDKKDLKHYTKIGWDLAEGFVDEGADYKSIAKEIKNDLGRKVSKQDVSDWIQDNVDDPRKTDPDEVADELKKAGVRVEGLEEGTWALPKTSKQKAELKKLMAKPLPVGDMDKEGPDDITNKLYNLVGDDELFDDLYDLYKKKGKNADALPLLKKALKRLTGKTWDKFGPNPTVLDQVQHRETILDTIGKKIQERKNG